MGTPEERLKKWISDFDGQNYANVDAATRTNIEAIKANYKPGNVKGLWVQVEVPKVNSSNLNPLGVILSAW